MVSTPLLGLITHFSSRKHLTKHLSLPSEFVNSLEPLCLLRHFVQYPPENFEAVVSPLGQPGFRMNFDLLTTIDAKARQRITSFPGSQWIRHLLIWPTWFWGTTVTEYLPLPAHMDATTLLTSMLETWKRSSQLLIIKDIPARSPLLSGSDNLGAEELLRACNDAGFIQIAGQALAYVPLDFGSTDAYLALLSSGRRKDLQRKMRKRAGLQIRLIHTGCEQLNDPAFLAALYTLYLNVYRQSELHFDKLSAEFFTAVLTDASLHGRLFVYYSGGALIGFNLCFIHNGMLIDKYVGFSYPAARQHNLYFISWMENLSFALSQRLTYYVAGWTDPDIKAKLGAHFTFTQHAVYVRNPILRRILTKLSRHFEHDKAWFEARRP